jgi:hypothetical protein
MQRPRPDDDSNVAPDLVPNDDRESTPKRPGTPDQRAKVTPMDQDKNIEDGIEIKET